MLDEGLLGTADGKARLTSLPGKMSSLQASAKGLLPSEIVHVLLPSDADHALELSLKHGGSVVVKVTDGFGHAVAGVGIHHKLPQRAVSEHWAASVSAAARVIRADSARFFIIN